MNTPEAISSQHAATSSRMRATWDALARRNAMHYISTDRVDWDRTAFLASGTERLTAIRELLGVDTADWRGTALDLGCGLGRFSFALAQDFEHVIAVDVSDEMIRRAHELAAELGEQRVAFYCNSGSDLGFVESNRCDLAFSYVVLQHIPDRTIVEQYIREMARVVRPGGHVLFQVLTYQETAPAHMLRLARPALVRLFGVLENAGLTAPEYGAAFQGSRLRLRELEAIITASKLAFVAVKRRHWQHILCDETIVYCRKPLMSYE